MCREYLLMDMCRRVCLWLAVRLPPTMETCIRWWYFKPESSDVEVTAFLAVTHLTSPGVRHPPGADPLVIRGRNQCRCLFLFFFTSQGTSRLQEALYKEEDISRKKKTQTSTDVATGDITDMWRVCSPGSVVGESQRPFPRRHLRRPSP